MRSKKIILWVLTVFVFVALPASAQRDTASVVGTVRDSSGALIPKATVTITNKDTGISASTTTDSAGQYVLSPLKVGDYSLRVDATGFARSEVKSFRLEVDQRLRLDVSLGLQKLHQQITVTNAPPVLQTQSATVGEVIGSRQMEDMPLNGRNFQGLAALVPGAIPSLGGRDSTATGGGVSLSGTRSWDNTFLLDGIDNNTNTAEMPNRVNLSVSPNLDAIQEFKIQSSSYDARYGRSVGGVINIVTKSGTNQLHGTLYDYHRNSALNANTWQNNSAGIKKGVRIRNQFGGVAGGPVMIPGLYDGRDHTFFFVDYEGTREILPPGFLNILLPDAKMQGGDFSEFLPGSSTNPTGTSFVLSAPYVNNVLPPGSADQAALALAKLYPGPNVSGTLNYQTNVRNTFDEDRYGIRLDHHFSPKDSIFGRYSHDYLGNNTGTWSDLLGPVTDNLTHGQAVMASWTHILRPTLVNEFRFGYTRDHQMRVPTAPNQDLLAKVGITGIPMQQNMPTGYFRFSGFPSIQPIGRRSGYYSDMGIVRDYMDNLTWVHGRHNIRTGGEIRAVRTEHFESQAPRGDFQFFGSNAADSASNPLAVGFAQFLTGQVSRVSFSTANDITYRQMNYAGYVEDNFRVTNSFTLDLGIRYEYYAPVNERHNNQAIFDIDRGEMIYPSSFKGTLPVAMAGIPVSRDGTPGLVTTDKNNWGPRLGFAYSFNSKTVVRGGYGVYYSFQEIGPWSYPSPGYNPPFNMVWSPTPTSLSGGYTLDPLTDPNAQFQIASLPAHMHTPHVQQWNVAVQRELAKNLTAEVDYSGSAGHNLYTLTYFNQAYPGTTFANLNQRLPFPYLQDTSQQSGNGGYSKYNALLVKVEKRTSKGLSFLASYTYGHTLDNASDDDLGSYHAGDTFRSPRHLNWEYGNSDFDVRHRFVLSGIYDLPIGRGRTYGANWNRLTDAIAGGWQVSWIWSAQSGYWFTPFGVNDSCFCNDGNAQSLRPDAMAGLSPNSGPRTPNEWFNVNAFNINVPAGRHGNAGRNTILGPGFDDIDLGLHKDFTFTESKRLEFRAEFFDLPNHPNWDRPVIDYGDSNIGRILTSRTSREIQLALKFVF